MFREIDKSLIIKWDLYEYLLWLENNYPSVYDDVSRDNNIKSLFNKSLQTFYAFGTSKSADIFKDTFPEPRA